MASEIPNLVHVKTIERHAQRTWWSMVIVGIWKFEHLHIYIIDRPGVEVPVKATGCARKEISCKLLSLKVTIAKLLLTDPV